MRLFINASNLRYGGGKTVAINIIKHYLDNDKIEKVVVAVPSGVGYEFLEKTDERLNFYFLSKYVNLLGFKPFLNYLLLPFLVSLNRSNFVLSLGNIAFPCLCNQFCLIHNPYLVYPDPNIWEKLYKENFQFTLKAKLMVVFIKFNLRFAQRYGVQTNVMKRRLVEFCNIEEGKIIIIPNSINIIQKSFNYLKTTRIEKRINLLFLSKFYPHKNFNIVLELAQLIKINKYPIKISLTLGIDEGAEDFLSSIKKNALDSIINNLGDVNLQDIPQVYSLHDGLFLPTLLESFSGTYIESMYYRKPVFTSNLDFAKNICADSAFYFDPLDARNILDVILDAFNDQELLTKKIESGYIIAKKSSTWEEIGNILDKEIFKINQK